uniref:Uncharacterized protein n=1 Tax=Rousettus aegyptiacus TaxID=9407 RepID=A0A7J8JFR6_ROUAE|nr:hypothetical protein HJG63_010126 [Rousettus aegyptiacus]
MLLIVWCTNNLIRIFKRVEKVPISIKIMLIGNEMVNTFFNYEHLAPDFFRGRELFRWQTTSLKIWKSCSIIQLTWVFEGPESAEGVCVLGDGYEGVMKPSIQTKESGAWGGAILGALKKQRE